MNLETERLNLKPISIAHFEEVNDLFTNDFVKRYLFDNRNLSRDEVLSFLEISQQNFTERGYGLWKITIIGDEEIIGFTGLWHFFDEEQPQLVYALLPAYTGQGFAREASREVMDYAFNRLGFLYLDASCDTPNLPSHKTALALGMKKLRVENMNGLPTTFYRKHSVKNA